MRNLVVLPILCVALLFGSGVVALAQSASKSPPLRAQIPDLVSKEAAKIVDAVSGENQTATENSDDNRSSKLRTLPLSPAQKKKSQDLRNELHAAQQRFDAELEQLHKANEELKEIVADYRQSGDRGSEVEGAQRLTRAFQLVIKCGQILLEREKTFPIEEAHYEANLRNVSRELANFAKIFKKKGRSGKLSSQYYLACAQSLESTSKVFSKRADDLNLQAAAIEEGFERVDEAVTLARDILAVLPWIEQGSKSDQAIQQQLAQLRTFTMEFDETIKSFLDFTAEMSAAPAPEL